MLTFSIFSHNYSDLQYVGDFWKDSGYVELTEKQPCEIKTSDIENLAIDLPHYSEDNFYQNITMGKFFVVGMLF